MTEQRTDHASGRRLLNATAVMASGTLISKVLGFVKASLLVIVLGASTPQADAYSLATLVPNTLYMIFAGGALNTVLVPQIVRHIHNDPDSGEAFVNRIMTAFLIVLAGVTALALAFTPQVMSLWTSASWRTPELAPHWDKLVLLAFVTMPQLFFYGAFFLIGQVLNARDKFGPMMWAPILNNVVGIGVLGVYAWTWGTNINHQVPFTTTQVMLLGIGSTFGIVVQTVALVPFMRMVGFRYRPRFDLKGTGLGATFHLAKWMLGYVLLTTIVQIVVQKLASGATIAIEGTPGAGVAAYNTANLVWLLPHSLLTVSLATAMLPSASRLAAVHDYSGVASETMRTLRLANTFLLPSSVGFLVLGMPFAKLAFGHGAASDQWMFIAWTLLAFAVGLVPFTIQYVYLRGYYALEDTRTPFFIQLIISGANVLLALGITAADNNPATVAPRLALAYSASYLIGAVVTHSALKRRLPELSGRKLLRHLGALAIAVTPGALVAGLAVWLLPATSTLKALGGFLAGLLAMALLFLVVAKQLRITEVTQVVAVMLRKGSPPPPSPEAPEPAPAASQETPAPDDDEQPALIYPDPLEGHDLLGDANDDLDVSVVEPGQVLDGRYRLEEALSRRGGTLTWRGFDELLWRPVLIHVMAPDEPRTLRILDEARMAAPAVDSRFLRVWDAVLAEDADHGSYIVCEYTPGISLELLLRQGPLSPVEAAWIIGEVADGLTGMHAAGLHHRRLNPDTVVVTTSGNVKIVGFLVEAALHPASANGRDGEAADVRALGELLYCALLARLPGRTGYGLPAAAVDAQGRPLLPRQVNAGVPVALSDVVDRVLNNPPVGRGQPITTVADLVAALAAATGRVDASQDLERRLRFPLTPIKFGSHAADEGGASEGGASEGAASQGAASETEDEHQVWTHRPPAEAPLERGSVETEGFVVDFDEPTDPEGTPFTPIPPPASAVRPETGPAPIITPTTAMTRRPPIRRRWMAVLATMFASVLVVSLIGVFIGQYERAQKPPLVPGFGAYAIHSAKDFDPKADGGDNTENPDLAGQAIDGSSSTAWTTERYGKSAKFNGRKPGAGLIVDLGSPLEVGRVRLKLGSGETTGEIRVPKDSTADSPSRRTIDDWIAVGKFTDETQTVTVTLDEPVTTRFVLVYLTKLPNRGSYYQGSISSIEVAPPK